MPSPPPTAIPITGAHRPTVREIRAPWISRASSSRPSPSVPSQCDILGAARRSSMSMSKGPCDSRTPAKIDTIATVTIQPTASQNKTPARRLRRTGLATVSISNSSVALADPRIEHGIEQVDDEIHDHEACGHEQHHALQDDEIPVIERAHQQAADSRQSEDGFDDQRAADQPTDIDAGDGDE